jgi:hypothetical protein
MDVIISQLLIFCFLKSRQDYNSFRTELHIDFVRSLDTLPSEIEAKFTFVPLGFPQGAVFLTCAETRFATYTVVSPSFSNR